jgi:hypothetical protein
MGAKMFQKIQHTVKFKDFSKTKGFNSEKKNSITPKHEMQLQLFSTKQYTKFQSYSCKDGYRKYGKLKNS